MKLNSRPITIRLVLIAYHSVYMLRTQWWNKFHHGKRRGCCCRSFLSHVSVCIALTCRARYWYGTAVCRSVQC